MSEPDQVRAVQCDSRARKLNDAAEILLAEWGPQDEKLARMLRDSAKVLQEERDAIWKEIGARARQENERRLVECEGCQRNERVGYGPSHDGAQRCRCGSLASGGAKAHCTCSACF